MARSIIGVDVSKHQYDCFDLSQGKAQAVSAQLLDPWIKQLRAQPEALVVCEATGVYSKRLLQTLSKAGVTCVEVNPRHVRRYAQACGQLAKNDRIDAKLIARYAEACAVQPKELTKHDTSILRALVTRREQLLTMIITEKGHLETCDTPSLRDAINAHLTLLAEQRKSIEQQIKAAMQHDPRAEILLSMPCIGDTVASSLLAHMPEIGNLKRGEAAALAGLAPYVRDSGMFKGKRAIYGGRSAIRRVLYMAALVAIRRNLTYQAAYGDLIARGKPFKVAITAIMRKIIETLNVMCKNQASWSAKNT